MYVTAIIAAGGRGERLGASRPKQLLEIDGQTILERSVNAFVSHADVTDVVVALPDDLVSRPPAYLTNAAKTLTVVAGGARRQDSVASAFRAVSTHADIVVIHDAARPFVSADLIARTIAEAAKHGAALAALQARDTVKSVSGGVVSATLDRETVFLAQTPQAFRRDVLRDALAVAGDATDEAALAEKAGHQVRIVEGDVSNIKITTLDDFALAETIVRSATERSAKARSAEAFALRTKEREGFSRAGIGYDVHRLVEGRPLILGGVTIPFEKGLTGHSDADAICHAVTDAILGAAGAGDIGRHFPDTDPAWKGASSIDLLRRAVDVIRAQGLLVSNVDATVILERPKLAPHVDAMRAKLADALGVTIDRVSIKGKTNEGVGELGRGEAIAVHAIAMVRNA